MSKKIILKLQEVITENGISQNELAKRLKLSPSTVNDMCTKEIKRVNIETLSKVINMFEIEDINDILTIVDEDSSKD